MTQNKAGIPALCVLLAAVAVPGQTDRPYRLLVAYTNDVAAALGNNVLGHVDNYVQHANMVYSQSGVTGLRAEVVCVYHWNYNETGNHGTDLARFAGDTTINDLRDLYRADLCCMLTETDTGGLATGVYQGRGDAYYHIWREVAHTGIVHEGGHIFGGRHTNQAACANRDPDTIPVPYCHGYHDPTNERSGWRDVMSNVCDTGPNAPYGDVIDYLSNPNIFHPTTGQRLGTASDNNAARLHHERIDGGADPQNHGAVRDYRTTPPTMTLSPGNNFQTIRANESAHAVATTTIFLNAGFEVQRGGRFAATIDANPYGKRRAPGRDGSSIPQAQTLPEGITLEVRAGSGGLLLRYGLHKALDVSVVLYDMQGRTVARKDLGLQPAGYHEQRVGLEAAARGAYSAVLEAGGSRSSRVVVRR